MNTKKILGIAAVTLLIAVALAGAGAAATPGTNDVIEELKGTTHVAYYNTFAAAVAGVADGNTLKLLKSGSETLQKDLSVTKSFTVTYEDAFTGKYDVDVNGHRIIIGDGVTVDFGTGVTGIDEQEALATKLINKEDLDYKGLKFYGKTWENTSSVLTVGDGASVSDLFIAFKDAATISNNCTFITLSGAAELDGCVFNFSGITSTSTSTIIGIMAKGTGDVSMEFVGIVNGNSKGHKSQTIVYSKTAGNLTIQDCAFIDNIEAGVSVNDRESVCLRMTTALAGSSVTIENSTLCSNESATNVGIAFDGISTGTATVNLNGAKFLLGNTGYDIWNEESAGAKMQVNFGTGKDYNGTAVTNSFGDDGLKIAFADSIGHANGSAAGAMTFSGSVPSEYFIAVMNSNASNVTGMPVNADAATLTNAMNLANAATRGCTVTLLDSACTNGLNVGTNVTFVITKGTTYTAGDKVVLAGKIVNNGVFNLNNKAIEQTGEFVNNGKILNDNNAVKTGTSAAATTTTAAKTPFPVLGILAGLGIAGFVAARIRR